jgi:hypothetical protein
MIRFTYLLLMTMNVAACQSNQHDVGFKSERISSTASFTVKTSVEKAFSLFGPIKEKEWARGWEPEIIFSESPEAEEHMIFKTSGKHHDEEYLWTITQFRPEEYLIEYTVSTPDRIWFIRVQCKSKDEETHTTVTYTYTGLNKKGNERNKEALDKIFAYNLSDWEAEINHYLQTGQQLKP